MVRKKLLPSERITKELVMTYEPCTILQQPFHYARPCVLHHVRYKNGLTHLQMKNWFGFWLLAVQASHCTQIADPFFVNRIRHFPLTFNACFVAAYLNS